MSGKARIPAGKMDPRIRRTRDALGDALVALMHEKPFPEITVQHVLDRAKVGRSTFYSHFSDKDDLFLSDAEDFFEGMSSLLARRAEISNRVAPVRELFAHVAEWRQFYDAMVASEKIHDILEMGREYFARSIAQRLAKLAAARGMEPAQRTVMAQGLAGAMFALLTWWIHSGRAIAPEQMDTIFHQMVWHGASSSSDTAFQTVSPSGQGKMRHPA